MLPVSMLRNDSTPELDDGPHTLRSVLHSPEISILRPSLHSLSLSSLEISQSPTRALFQEPPKGQCSVLDTKALCTTAKFSHESSSINLVPEEISTCTTKDESIQQASEKNKEAVSENNKDEQILVRSTQTVPAPPNLNLPELLGESSHGVTVHKSNHLSEPTSSCSLVPEPKVISNSHVLPSPPVYPSISLPPFFSFVIFHSPEDQEIAIRVCNVLEELGVGKGTTFCEGFETPGISPLISLENAVESSAYIILLLTNVFLKDAWGVYQSTSALMNSIENAESFGSVIPFYPRSKKPDGKIPVWIKNLHPLDESSPIFKTKVSNTFRKDVIMRRKMNRTLSNISSQQPGISLQCNMGDTTTLASEQTQHSLSLFHGQTPVIQINHAGNVQIGNQNSMNIHFPQNELQMSWDPSSYQDVESETPN